MPFGEFVDRGVGGLGTAFALKDKGWDVADIGGVGIIVEADDLVIVSFGEDGGEKVGGAQADALRQTAQNGQVADVLRPLPEGSVNGFVVGVEIYRNFILNIGGAFSSLGAWGNSGSGPSSSLSGS